MSRLHAENVIQNIIREIIQRCSRQGQTVSESLTAFMIKAVVLDPRNIFNIDRLLTKQDVENLIELCANKLLEKNPALDTIEMQVHFDTNYISRRDFLKEHQKMRQMNLLPMCQEIMDSSAKSRAERDDLYNKIVTYIVVRSSLGSASNEANMQEATAALQSVFHPSNMAAFMSLPKPDKEQQLNELTMIVTGIRLFNKDHGKGGKSFEDLPAVLNETLPAINAYVEHELEATQHSAWCFTALLERSSASDPDAELDTDLLTQALYNLRQHEAFLKILLADIITCSKQVETLQTDVISKMKVLKTFINTKIAVPSSQVFPYFTVLARLWTGLQHEMLLLNTLRSMVQSLRPFLSTESLLQENLLLDQMLEDEPTKSDAERAAESSEEQVDPVEMKSYEWILPETTENFEQLPLEYKGVCGYTLVEKNGLLLPGNRNIGILKHREKYYSFSSRQAAYEFASKADDYIELIEERVKRSPELIYLLGLHQQFASITPYLQMQSGENQLVSRGSKCESGAQTDTHLLESNIDRSYEWNEWELRRKAVKLTNLRRKVTKSMQTDQSHIRRENNTQTYLPKDSACQTKRDGQSNVPKPQIYLAGLRGRTSPATCENKIDLTRSVED